MSNTKLFEDLLSDIQESDDADDANKAFANLLQSTAGATIANRLNPPEIQIPEPGNYDALIGGSYQQATGSAIPFFTLQNTRNFLQGAGIRNPNDIQSFVTQNIMAQPGNVAGLTQDDYRKKMAAYYGQENVNPETGMYTGTFGRGINNNKRIQGRPDYT